jgi:hypothetical protein
MEELGRMVPAERQAPGPVGGNELIPGDDQRDGPLYMLYTIRL